MVGAAIGVQTIKPYKPWAWFTPARSAQAKPSGMVPKVVVVPAVRSGIRFLGLLFSNGIFIIPRLYGSCHIHWIRNITFSYERRRPMLM
jgi:hypothetical protein